MGYLKNKKHRLVLFLIVFILGSIGYRQVYSMYTGYMQAKAAKVPKEVQIMNPVEMDAYSKSESAGRVEAKYSVDIVARINGWLQRSYFKEGDKVKKGQLLFLIEPDQYQNLVNTAAANVRQAQATLINAEKELTRAKELVKNIVRIKAIFLIKKSPSLYKHDSLFFQRMQYLKILHLYEIYKFINKLFFR